MKKAEQLEINAQVTEAKTSCLDEYHGQKYLYSTRLRNCQAEVYILPSYYVLRSYSTIIACIDKETHILYDFLRDVYGYTATSSKQISKFGHDYNERERLTYREV